MKTQIIAKDDSILVCFKPAGIAVQSGRAGESDVESELKCYLARSGGRDKGGVPFLGVIHRLDQPVSGILVFARTPAVAAKLNHQMADGEIDKYYYAWTEAVCDKSAKETAEALEEGRSGRLEDYLQKSAGTNTSAVVSENTAGAKKAVLEYRVLKREGSKALLEIHLLTGRHHQIRVQLAHAGFPLIGDHKYGSKTGGPLLLCAYKLSFTHPQTCRKLTYETDRFPMTLSPIYGG